MTDSTDLTAVLTELAQTRAALVDAVTKMRRRNRAFAAMSVLSILFLIGYLGYAAVRFGGDVTPELVAANVQSGFVSSLPNARVQLEQNLRDIAPKFVGNAFDQLQAMPVKYADDLQAEATRRMDAAIPAMQDEMYQSMKAALDQSVRGTAAPAGGSTPASDEARLQGTLKAVGEVYATDTMKFVNQIHNTYASDAIAFVDYLDRLAQNQGLDHRDQLHREMFRTAFALVQEAPATK